jgi:hypothetical protein
MAEFAEPAQGEVPQDHESEDAIERDDSDVVKSEDESGGDENLGLAEADVKSEDESDGNDENLGLAEAVASEPGSDFEDDHRYELEPPPLSVGGQLSATPQPTEGGPPTILGIIVESSIPHGRSLEDESEIFDNVISRIRDRGAALGMHLEFDELFVRMRTHAQMERLFDRINANTILGGTVTLRLNICSTFNNQTTYIFMCLQFITNHGGIV